MINILISNRCDILSSLASSWIESKLSPKVSRGYTFDDETYYDIYGDVYPVFPGWDDEDSAEAEYLAYCESEEKRKKKKKVRGGCTDIRDILSDNIWDDDISWEDVVEKYDTENKVRTVIEKFMGVSVGGKKVKMRHRGKKNKVYESDLFAGVHNQKEQEETDWRKEVRDETVNDSDMRSIFFYNDGRDESSAEHFTTLDEFFSYCSDNMILIDADAQSDIEFYTQCHCALDEYSLDHGYKELRVARSYGELVYDLYGEELYSESSSFGD